MRRAIKQRRYSRPLPRAAGTATGCFWPAMSPKGESQMKSRVIVVEDHPVLSGELYFSERVAAAVMQRSLREKPTASGLGLERLSDRELQVFQLLGASCSAREIAEQFHLSRKTIETHCERIKHKLSLHNAAELKQFARKWAAENFGPRTVGGAAITKRSLKEVALSKN